MHSGLCLSKREVCKLALSVKREFILTQGEVKVVVWLGLKAPLFSLSGDMNKQQAVFSPANVNKVV